MGLYEMQQRYCLISKKHLKVAFSCYRRKLKSKREKRKRCLNYFAIIDRKAQWKNIHFEIIDFDNWKKKETMLNGHVSCN